jgi:predicted acylesterase/phospholipase RssA
MKTYRGVVLSGGGARGPYGAGVLVALDEFEKLEIEKSKATNFSHFYVGSSAGALNAVMAAQGDVDRLVQIHCSKGPREILGVDSTEVSKYKLFLRAKRQPFSYFSNESLRRLLQEHVSWSRLVKADLLITATHYETGELATFFRSDLVTQFVQKDETLPPDSRRLNHYRQIPNADDLVTALLASAAIPFFFPPVRIGSGHYVDGGVGNNTPTRQAAYFLRYLEESGFGTGDFVICVDQDPVSFVVPPNHKMTLSSVLQRTLDVFMHELSGRMIEGWHRINYEVNKASKKQAELEDFINAAPGITPEYKQKLLERVEGLFHLTSASTHRKEVPLLQVRPSTSLEIGTLDFSPSQAGTLVRRGYEDFLAVLENRGRISPGERKHLSDRQGLPF